MKLYSFELGRVTNLCLAELVSLFDEKNLVEKIGHSAIFNLEIKENEIQKLQDKLGGTIKISEIIETFQTNKKSEAENFIKSSLKKILTNEFKDHSKGKIIFALSTINIPFNSKIFLKSILIFSKKFLKSLNLSSRFVNKPWNNPTPAQIYKSRATEKGIDLTILRGEKQTYITKTLSIQNIDAYSHRDYEKPFRDARMGMLPPKLAQIMINLAEPCKTICDPFCGSGTILMEALLQGKKVIGSDINQKAVEGSIKNLNWLVNSPTLRCIPLSGAFPSSPPDFHVFQKDAQEIDKKGFDTIVSETFLGPPQSKFPGEKETNKIFAEILALHNSWLPKAAKLLPKNGKIVICLPAFRTSKNSYKFFPDLPLKRLNKSRLIYDREDQIVAREIVILEKS